MNIHFPKIFSFRSVQISLALYLVYSIGSAFAPLLAAFGFEYALLHAVLSAFLCAWIASDLTARIAHSPNADFPAQAILAVGYVPFAIGLVVLQWVLIGFSGLSHAFVSAIMGGTCNFRIGTAWFVSLPMVTACFATVWGMVFGAICKTRTRAIIAALVTVLAGILFSVGQMAVGPHCFTFNPFFGYFPGPIYDRVVPLTAEFLTYRLVTLVYALLFGSALLLALKKAVRKAGLPARAGAGEVFTFTLCLIALIVYLPFRDDLGLVSSKSIIQKELSAVRTTEHFQIHYPPDGPVADQIDWIATDHEFRFKQITSELNIDFPWTIHSYIYQSDSQKKKLQGAGSTMYADVSNRSIHMSYRSFPHRVLKHELTHVITAPWGIPYFGWSAVIALTEGVATSVEDYRGDGTIHEWAAAMMDLHKMPDLVDILAPLGFWTKLGSKSYLAAGSFSLWLRQTYGVEKFQAAYRWGAFEKVYGQSIESLRDRWMAFLGTVEIGDRLMAQARHKFTRRSLFDQRCAREVERLYRKGRNLAGKGKYHKALAPLYRAYEVAPDNPKTAIALMDAFVGAKDYDAAVGIGDRLVESLGGVAVLAKDYQGSQSPRPIVQALLRIARLSWMRSDLPLASTNYQALLESDYNDLYTRISLCALHGLSRPDLEPYFRLYFASDIPRTAQEYYLVRAVDNFPNDPVPEYLLGLSLFYDDQYFAATSHLLAAIRNDRLNEPLRVEALDRLGRSLYFQKRFDEAETVFEMLLPSTTSNGHKRNTYEWIERVKFSRIFMTPKITTKP